MTFWASTPSRAVSQSSIVIALPNLAFGEVICVCFICTQPSRRTQETVNPTADRIEVGANDVGGGINPSD